MSPFSRAPQQAAVRHVTHVAREATADARCRIQALLGPAADVDALGTGLFRRGGVAVHFHPDLWEAAMFGGAYQRSGVRPADRPVYGALDLLGHADELGPRDVAGLLRSASGAVAATHRLGRAMNEYLEAQVHGPVRPAEDADELVADPSFRGTEAERETRGQTWAPRPSACGT